MSHRTPPARFSPAFPRPLDHLGTPLGDAFDAYLSELASFGRRTPETLRTLEYVTGLYCSYLARAGVQAPGDMRRSHLVAYFGYLDAAAVRPSTASDYLGYAFSFVRWLYASGHLDRDLTVGLRRPRVPRTYQRAMTAAELVAFLDPALHTPRSFVAAATLCLYGLRVAELGTTRLDPSGDLSVVGKGGHARPCLLPVRLSAYRDVVAFYRSPFADRSDYLLTSEKTPGRPVLSRTTSRTMLEPALIAAGLGTGFHAIRRGVATAGVASGAFDSVSMAHLLGHAVDTVTGRYRIPSADDLAARLERHPFYPLVSSRCLEFLASRA